MPRRVLRAQLVNAAGRKHVRIDWRQQLAAFCDLVIERGGYFGQGLP
ncbi:MAG: hypothetical protein WB682_11845 [Candidatus Dormiibacterota bacterium]